jgi:hypothetical protein
MACREAIVDGQLADLWQAEAKTLGSLYGFCVRCGATLTDDASIKAGIGPICAKRF